MKIQHDLKVRLRYHKACIKCLRLQISYKISRLRKIPFNQINSQLELLRNHTNMEIVFKRQLSNLA
jgi:hypothetical protein